MIKKNIFTTFETSGLCGVANSTVINWVNEGKLPAYLTPGGHRRIKKEDLVLFLKKFNMPVPAELSNEKKKRIMEKGADFYLVKPVDKKTFEECLSKMLEI